MAAYADDERYYYAEDIGDTVELTLAGAAASEQLRAEPLTPGRYILRVTAWSTATQLWVRQGAAGDVTANNAAPSMMFVPPTDPGFNNFPLLFFMVRAGGKGSDANASRNMLAFYAVTAACTVQVTKVSRDKA